MKAHSAIAHAAPRLREGGYTLTEVLLALAVMAVTLPLMMGLVLAGGESSRQAERETRAVITARSVFEELRRAENDNSAIVAQADLPWNADRSAANGSVASGGGALGVPPSDDDGPDGWIIFEVNQEGDLLAVADDMDYEDRWEGSDAQVVSIVAARRYSQELEDVEGPNGEPMQVFRLEVRVETPARASAETRERTVFTKSASFR